MKLKQFVLAGALALGALVLAACGGSDEDVPGNAVAQFSDCGESVTKSEFNQVLGQARTSFERNKRPFPKAGTPEYNALRNQVVTYLVQRAGYRCEAEELDVSVSDEKVEERLKQLVRQYYGGSEEKYKKALSEQGVTEAQLRDEIEAQLLQEGIFKQVTADVQVTDKEVREFYEKNTEQYSQPAQRDIRHILVKKRPLADQLLAQLRSGASFATLARKHSTDPGSKKKGGKLEIAQGQTVPPFDKAAFSLGTNELSQPIKTQYGWHIIQPLGKVTAAHTTPFKQVRQAIRQQLLQTKRNEAAQKWAEKLRKELEGGDVVKYQVGFAPPKQTQTTTAPATTSG